MAASSRPAANSVLRDLAPAARLAAIADEGTVASLDTPRPSSHLARYGIAARDDDGIVTARLRVDGRTWLAAAQDERFLGGSVGAAHGEALRALFERARAERPHGVVLLAASAGVRLHEGNPAELALARALRAFVDLRAAGIATAAVAVGDVFGGTSVLACAADRFAAVPEIRLGLSGPKVVETARGAAELDASNAAHVEAVYGVAQRVSHGFVEGVRDDARAVADWLAPIGAAISFEEAVAARAAALGCDVASGGPGALPSDWSAEWIAAGLWRHPDTWIVAPFAPQPADAARLCALDAALLERVGTAEGPRRLLILEDSPGHEVSRAGETLFQSRYLAHHARVLGVLRARGIRIAGALIGTGHGAAFFANALQAGALGAVAGARVIAMPPEAIARVTGVDAAARIEDDPLLGHPVRHFAALGGVDRLLPDASLASVLAFARTL
jgi:malonate decarboxylase beta subunit